MSAQTEGFPDLSLPLLATDFFYVRRSAATPGTRDTRFANANLTAFCNLALAADELTYSTGTGTLATTALTALARSLLGRATDVLMRGDLGFLTATATLDFGSISAAASADLTITVTGATAGDAVLLGLPAAPTAGIVFFGFVSATNTVTVRAMNITSGGVDPASASYRATVIKST